MGPISITFLVLIMLALPGATGVGIAAAGGIIVLERLLARAGVSGGLRGFGMVFLAILLFAGMPLTLRWLEPSKDSPLIVIIYLTFDIGLFAYGCFIFDD